MNINSILYQVIAVILGANMMSFAWPLRGQFGGPQGALVTGAMAGCIACVLIPWKSYRQALAQAVVWGGLGFLAGGQNIPYGAIIDFILAQPNLSSVIPQLLTLFFIGASWGCIGATYLGYGVSEKNMSFWDYAIIFILGVAAVVVTSVISANWGWFLFFTLLIILLQLYNFIFKHSKIVFVFGLSGLLFFGLGFLGAVIILFYGDKGMLPGPPDWWTLRDQMWGASGGLGLILAAYYCVKQNWHPMQVSPVWFQRLGYIIFIPVICGINLFNVFTKWFWSSPQAPDLVLAVILLGLGAIVLFGWLIYYLVVNGGLFRSPVLKPMILCSFLFFSFFLRFYAIAKSIIYSGWGVWETGFSIFLFETMMLFLTMPFVLLGQENP